MWYRPSFWDVVRMIFSPKLASMPSVEQLARENRALRLKVAELRRENEHLRFVAAAQRTGMLQRLN